MNRGFIVGIVLFLICGSVSGQYYVEKGLLDLTENGFRKNPVIKLNGEWEFYWHKHLQPYDFISNDSIAPDLYGMVPSYWTDYIDSLPTITPTGYATYRMRLLLPEYFRNQLTFQIPVFDSSYRLYIDGKFVGSNGITGSREAETMPGYNPLTISHLPENDTLEIIINVSNFHHRRGGFWLPMTVGTSDEMVLKVKRNDTYNSATLGMLFAFSGFFFLFYIIFRRDRTMLYFSLSTLGIMIRTLFTGSFPVLAFLNIQWVWIIRMEYVGSYLAFIFALLYFFRIYPNTIIKYITASLVIIFSGLILIVISTPVSIFSYTMLIFFPAMFISLVYYGIRSIISVYRVRQVEGLIALGFAALVIGTVNDIFISTSSVFITQEYILQYSFIFFILMQAIVLIYKWVDSYNEERRLVNEIEFVNKNLENIVIERTSELTNQKAELEKQYELVGSKNKELVKNISIKNRIFSIIAHDLKSPVLNLSLMIDHLGKNSDRTTFEKVTNALSQQSGFAITLIDNLLLWGEGQQNKIDYDPGHHNLTDLILENFNLLKKNAVMKEITMNYSHRGESYAICDRNLANIIIRNLLSNAIKFTHKGGNISVSVEEPVIKNGTINLKIRDNGVGIPEDKLKKLFNEDHIYSTAGTENEKGTGLGLHLCYDLVSINKGTIKVDSSLEKGTTFTVMFPAPINK